MSPCTQPSAYTPHLITPVRLGPSLRKCRHREFLCLTQGRPTVERESLPSSPEPMHLHTTLFGRPCNKPQHVDGHTQAISMVRQESCLHPRGVGRLGWRSPPSMDKRLCIRIQSHLLQGLPGWVGSFPRVPPPRVSLAKLSCYHPLHAHPWH